MLPCVKAAGRRPTVSSPCFPRSPSARSRNSSAASRPEASADRLHPIADAADGADQHMTRMVPQLLAEVADMDLDQMRVGRSEEHTSELQSLMRISYAVFCLKKKQNTAFHTQLYRASEITTNNPTR